MGNKLCKNKRVHNIICEITSIPICDQDQRLEGLNLLDQTVPLESDDAYHFRHLNADPSQNVFTLRNNEEELIGAMCVKSQKIGKCWFVEGLGIHEKFRKRGYSTLFMKRMSWHLSKKNGKTALFLLDAVSIQDFYEMIGMQTIRDENETNWSEEACDRLREEVGNYPWKAILSQEYGKEGMLPVKYCILHEKDSYNKVRLQELSDSMAIEIAKIT